MDEPQVPQIRPLFDPITREQQLKLDQIRHSA
jgi:hypothetical protein